MVLEEQKIKALCIKNLGFNEINANFFAKDFPREIGEELSEVFIMWVEKSIISDKEILPGLSIKKLVEIRGCNFLEAIKLANKLFDQELSEDERSQIVKQLLTPTIVW